MVPLRLIVAALLSSAVVGCADTGAAPADRDREIEQLEQTIDAVAPDRWRLEEEGEFGAGCSLRDCVVLQRIYVPEPAVSDCDNLARLLDDAGVTEVTPKERESTCEVGGWHDKIVVSAILLPEGHVQVSVNYPKG